MMGTFPDIFNLDLVPTEDGLVYVGGIKDVSAVFDQSAPISEIIEWADARPSFTLKQPYSHREPGLAIRFDNTTGFLYLRAANGTEVKFDPHSDEALARLVRKVKAHAPVASNIGGQQTLPGLPEPTPEQMANRTIYSAVGVPDGVGRYKAKKPKPRYQQPTASAQRSQEIANEIMADFLGTDFEL